MTMSARAQRKRQIRAADPIHRLLGGSLERWMGPARESCAMWDSPTLAFDAETFPNFAGFGIRDLVNNETPPRFFSTEPGIGEPLSAARHWFAAAKQTSLLIGFNNLAYDNTMLQAMLTQHVDDPRKLFSLSRRLIEAKRHRLDTIDGELNLDLLAMLGGAKSKVGSLKECGVKCGYPTLMELPYTWDQPLDREQMDHVRHYNVHDLNITALIAQSQHPVIAGRLALSDYYGLPLWNQHDAGLGAAVIARVMGKRSFPKATVWQTCGERYVHGFSFEHAALADMRERLRTRQMSWELETVIDAESGDTEKKIKFAKVSDSVEVDGVSYRLGVGGLHSEDGPGIFEADAQYRLIDVDIEGFYPRLMLVRQLYPQHLDPSFLTALEGLLQHRLRAKASGQKALSDGLKVAVNSVFGKTKSGYSWLLDPVMSTEITVCGQLILLSFIDLLHGIDGVQVVSANTDGLTLRLHRDLADDVLTVLHGHAKAMGFTLDESEYSKLIRRDISNYIAVPLDPTRAAKCKGSYSRNRSDLSRKPTLRIVTEAVRAFFVHGAPLIDSIRNCTEIDEFIDYFKCSKGYVIEDERGEQHGSIARWYLSTSGVHLDKVQIQSGKRTQLVDHGAQVVSDLPSTLPSDVDVEAYVAIADKLVQAILNPAIVVSHTIPHAELSHAQRDRLYVCQTDNRINLDKLAALDLSRYHAEFAAKLKGNSYDTMKHLLVRRWLASRGDLTVAELGWVGRELDAAGGAFAGAGKRNLEAMCEWIGREISPFPTPQTNAQQIARALTWAEENCTRAKVKRKMWHRGAQDSRYFTSTALVQWRKTGNTYRLACVICANAIKHTDQPDAEFLTQILDDAVNYDPIHPPADARTHVALAAASRLF